jgi:hypothetical protein
MADRLDPAFVRAQIEALRVSYPGIWDDDDQQLLADMLEGETGFNEFLTGVVRRMCEADALASGIGNLLVDLRERQRRFYDRNDAMRALAFKLMQQAAVRKVELPQATLSIRAGQQKVIITDETALPPNCVRIRTEPDKVAIKEHLTRGEPVAGAELSNSEPVLAVRVK